jgi:hypothetical protein
MRLAVKTEEMAKKDCIFLMNLEIVSQTVKHLGDFFSGSFRVFGGDLPELLKISTGKWNLIPAFLKC